jgi:hypothetical protein
MQGRPVLRDIDLLSRSHVGKLFCGTGFLCQIVQRRSDGTVQTLAGKIEKKSRYAQRKIGEPAWRLHQVFQMEIRCVHPESLVLQGVETDGIMHGGISPYTEFIKIIDTVPTVTGPLKIVNQYFCC